MKADRADKSVTAQFKGTRRRQLFITVSGMGMFALLIVDELRESVLIGVPDDILLKAFWGVLAAMFVLTLWNWRCPACRRYLGRSWTIKFCPKCGTRLME